MAVSFVANRGTVGINSVTTQTISLNATPAVGNVITLSIAASNSGGGGAARTLSTVFSSRSGQMTLIGTTNVDPGAADAGVTNHLLYQVVTTQVQNDYWTVQFSGTVLALAMSIDEWTGIDAANLPAASSGVVGTANATTTAATLHTPNAVGDAVIVHIAARATVAYIPDADTLQGSWVNRGGPAMGNHVSQLQYKIVTGTSQQSHQGSWSSATPSTSVGFVFRAAPLAPTITQASYRWFDEGTETGAVALAAQDTAATGDVTVNDGIGQLRVRLQSTNAGVIAATDDWQLQVEKNASGTWTDVTAASSTAKGYNSPNLTDAAATSNRLGAGTGSFVAGEISETGLVTNLGWTANNYTELLYSLALVKADLAGGDTLRFRVLRNGATTGLTYTQTPTINVTAAIPANAQTATGTGAITPSVIATVSSTFSDPASGTGTAYNASIPQQVPASTATATGITNSATVSTTDTAPAGVATGTGAITPSVIVTITSTVANTSSATGTAYVATVTAVAVVNVPANAATATGVALQPSVTQTVSASANTATVTGTVDPATVTTTRAATATTATATGTANSAAPSTTRSASATTATGTGTAYSGVPNSGPRQASAPTIFFAGLAYNTYPLVITGTATAGAASGTGTANNASASAAGTANTLPTTATGTGNSYSPTITVSRSATAGAATAAGAAFAPTVSTTRSALATAATGSGIGYTAAPSTASQQQALAGIATGAGAAFQAGFAATGRAPATLASATGTAYPATPTTASLTICNASAATGTGTAYLPARGVRTSVSPAAGTGTAPPAAAATASLTLVTASAASGTGTGLPAAVRTRPTATVGLGSGTAYPATVTAETFAAVIGHWNGQATLAVMWGGEDVVDWMLTPP